MFEKIASRLHSCSADVCKPIIELAVEVAREGREGRRIGTLFTIGDAIVAGCRYLDVKVSDVQLPMGLGSRHLAAASISRVTRAVAVVVSESAQEVRIFEAGVLVGDIIPELWLLSREHIVQSREK